jgi:hypothetical protein
MHNNFAEFLTNGGWNTPTHILEFYAPVAPIVCTHKVENAKGKGCTCTRCTRGSGIPGWSEGTARIYSFLVAIFFSCMKELGNFFHEAIEQQLSPDKLYHPNPWPKPSLHFLFYYFPTDKMLLPLWLLLPGIREDKFTFRSVIHNEECLNLQDG